MGKYNSINMKKWKEYKDIYTDSLWIINKRDSSGAHEFRYHGNFIPQIPFQLFSRYTKEGDWILDPFMGSGTSLIEAQRMNRNSIGIELQKKISNGAKKRIEQEKNKKVKTIIVNGDSKEYPIKTILQKHKIKKVQFIIFHPPYWDIIKFSKNRNDLSNCSTLDSFKQSLSMVIDNTTKFLEDERYCAIVIGDKYANSQLIPLGFICMNIFLDKGFILKAILVKNFGDTEGKNKQQAIWRYRALSADYYLFKHEYIMIFKKKKTKK